MQNLLQNTQVLDKQKKIALSVADKIEFVEIGSIIRCESESNYTTFYLKSGEKLIVSKTLKEFDELLTPYNFLRVHQSHLINLDEIKSFIKSDGGYIRMKDGASVSISPTAELCDGGIKAIINQAIYITAHSLYFKSKRPSTMRPPSKVPLNTPPDIREM